MTVYLSVSEIADDVMLYKLTESAKRAFRQLDRMGLVQLHASIGASIRNEYHLWDEQNPYTLKDYQPILDDGVDINPKHPDSVSFLVIETIWDRMQ